MFRQVSDFYPQWQHEMDATLKVLRALTDESLGQRVDPNGRTLGRLAWHITQTLPEMMNRTGLAVTGPGEDEPIPAHAAEIADTYEECAKALVEQVRGWSDEKLLEQVEMYGDSWPNGITLEVLIRHQAHHRGQMTVLMRQAGITVPGVYGPAREEWVAYGMAAQE